MYAFKLPCFIPEWKKRKRRGYDSNFIIASLFVQKDNFIDAVDLNTEPSGLNHRNIGEVLSKIL